MLSPSTPSKEVNGILSVISPIRKVSTSLSTKKGDASSTDGPTIFCRIEARFYNDVPLDMIVGEKAGTRNGIQGMAQLLLYTKHCLQCLIALADAGIAGRGVLLDFYAYAKEKGLEYEPWSQ